MEQKLQTLNQQNKLTLWSERISACRDSGKSVKTWCKDHNICEATFYKWQKKLFEMVNHQQTCFAEVTSLVQDTNTIAVTVRIAGAEADIHSGADAATVETVLRILQSC